MKEYLKPEVEVVNFAAEAITIDIGDGDTTSADVTRPIEP